LNPSLRGHPNIPHYISECAVTVPTTHSATSSSQWAMAARF
jgi:hypothetical protein